MATSRASSSELPTGTVTFLFTDIEASTRLLQAVGQEAFRDLVEEHTRILRDAVAHAGGVEVATEGDSFFAVFESATKAVSAAVTAQRSLVAHPWPEGGLVHVRMGLHTGEGRLGGDNYLGIEVHRAARIAAAGHGGQILVSGATSALVDRNLPEGTTLRDLGEHRLKDLAVPERIFQVLSAGLPNDFPDLRTLDGRPTNLPADLTAFVGRDGEIDEVLGLLHDARLVTLTGPGGTGKTRLGLRVAALAFTDFAHGAFFVPLAPIGDPELVPATIGRALGVVERPDAPVSQVIVERLRDREVLLVLDNFEQVLPAGRYVSHLLETCPGVSCLITSRAVLHVVGEQEYPVPPLSLPDSLHPPPPDVLSQYDAVTLFLARARAVDPHFEVTDDNAAAIAHITARLDGLPLAIELAAARVKMLSPSEILTRLEKERLGLLRAPQADSPARQRTLRDTIQWSYDLLSGEQKALFRHLGVFVGGFALLSAETLADGDADALDCITALADNSLVRRVAVGPGRSRYEMLETVREFAVEEMRSHGELEEVARRHALHFLTLAEDSEPHLLGGDQVTWLDRLENEHDNLRAAFAWARENAPEQGARAAAAIWRFFQFRSHLREGSRLLVDLLERPKMGEATEVRARTLVGLAGLTYWQADYGEAIRLYEEALDIYERLGDRANVADTLYSLSTAHGMAADHETGRRYAEESLEISEEIGDEVGSARAQASLGWYHYGAGEHRAARQRAERAEAVFREHGMPYEHATSLGMVAFFTFAEGNPDAAWPMMLDVLGRYEEMGDRGNIAGILDGLAVMAAATDDLDRGLLLAGAAETIRADIEGGAPPGTIPMGDPREVARETLTEEEIEAGLEAGRRLTLEEALAEARRA